MMFLRKIFCNCRPLIKNHSKQYSKRKDPFSRTWGLLSTEIPVTLGLRKPVPVYPEHADVVIIGSGFIGASAAYWLKTRAGEGLSVVLIDKDFSFKNASKHSSLGRIHQHYSLPENIQLAQYSAEFLRNSRQYLGDDVDIEYYPNNYLVLASNKYAHKLEENVTLQNEYGVKNVLYTDYEMGQKYPWMSTSDIKLGCTAIEQEGTFNPWALLGGLIKKSKELGTTIVEGEVVEFEMVHQRDVLMEGVEPGTFERINKVVYKTSDGEEYALKFAICILAAGQESGQIGQLAKMGNGPGMLSIPLPVVKREQKVFRTENLDKTNKLNTPFIMDTSGLWISNKALENNLLCGHLPLMELEEQQLTIEEYLESIIKPALINRIPDFSNINLSSLKNYFTEVNDHNSFDENGIIGPHPYHQNVYIATGFGMQGCAHSPAIGRSLAELVIDGHYTTIDMTRLCFDRLLTHDPMFEFNVY